MKTSRFLPPFLATLTITANLFAQDQDRSVDEAQRLMQRAVKAKQEGRYDEARELHEQFERLRNREARERIGRKEQPDRARDERFARMKQEIEELRRSGKNDEAEARMRQMREEWERGQGEGRDRKEGEGPAKIRHIMEAVRHLRAAGMKEPAAHLEQQAQRMREEFEQQQREGNKKPDKERSATAAREVNELREQVQRLEREMAKLREELRHRHGAEADVQ